MKNFFRNWHSIGHETEAKFKIDKRFSGQLIKSDTVFQALIKFLKWTTQTPNLLAIANRLYNYGKMALAHACFLD